MDMAQDNAGSDEGDGNRARRAVLSPIAEPPYSKADVESSTSNIYDSENYRGYSGDTVGDRRNFFDEAERDNSSTRDRRCIVD